MINNLITISAIVFVIIFVILFLYNFFSNPFKYYRICEYCGDILVSNKQHICEEYVLKIIESQSNVIDTTFYHRVHFYLLCKNCRTKIRYNMLIPKGYGQKLGHLNKINHCSKCKVAI